MTTISAIQASVCLAFHVRPIDMISDRRGWECAHPRQVAMYLARELTRHSLPRIGHFFGKRDHTTVMHAIRAVERRMADDPFLAMKVRALQAALTPVNDLEEAA